MARQRCWNCGEDMGEKTRHSDPRDTCGAAECIREGRDQDRAEREEAHHQLDRDMGW